MKSGGHPLFYREHTIPTNIIIRQVHCLVEIFRLLAQILPQNLLNLTSLMPSKSATRSTKHRLSTTEKAIHKRPPRTRASAAIKTATQALLPKGRHSARRTVTPAASQVSLTSSHSDASVTADIADIKLIQEGFSDALDEIKERFEGLESSIMTTITNALENRSPPAANAFTRSFAGMNPAEALQSVMSWVESSVMTNVVARTLDVTHFIKLLPILERPKGQVNPGTTSNVVINSETGKTSISESTVNYEKVYTDSATLINALTLYAVIRDLYDVDNLGFGPAIFLYVRQILVWSKKYKWSAIVNYFVAHFTKYQSTNDPHEWYKTDLQMFADHLSSEKLPALPPPAKSRSSASSSAPTSSKSVVCKNWNSEKGCTWKTCPRTHACLQCGKDHTVLLCTESSR
jgi:hypothetical protein